MLFSEPKIPQFADVRAILNRIISFSALQRAENSSIPAVVAAICFFVSFSALQRAENSSMSRVYTHCLERNVSFSALQRAENSSILSEDPALLALFRAFQCSSASRKFLNLRLSLRSSALSSPCFSALQRAENSSITSETDCRNSSRGCFSALQRAENSSIAIRSVVAAKRRRFSALQRAENSSMRSVACPPFDIHRFSALQRAENSSIPRN